MADIEDEVEFEEMLRFVLDQWRNVRQRKSVPMRKSEDGENGKEMNKDDIQSELNISSSEGEEASKSSGKVKIRLNPKAKKGGRSQER
ncbi:hypothetical protein PInf_029364 [Phytophthora infestans]|nr:hypothetical protein PInf_029364 [Phytophthora infestans]